MGAWASFLLAVEPVGSAGAHARAQQPRSAVAFGINAFWRDGQHGQPYARVHPQYRWPIGTPTHSFPAEQFDRYSLPLPAGANASARVYARQFTNGIAVHNPSGADVDDVPLPGAPYVDPSTNTSGLTHVSLSSQRGRVLLRRWP